MSGRNAAKRLNAPSERMDGTATKYATAYFGIRSDRYSASSARWRRHFRGEVLRSASFTPTVMMMAPYLARVTVDKNPRVARITMSLSQTTSTVTPRPEAAEICLAS